MLQTKVCICLNVGYLANIKLGKRVTWVDLLSEYTIEVEETSWNND